jgi:hypothetical protein
VNAADRIIREITAQQHGAASRAQLLSAGVALHLLDARVRSGHLIVRHRGVYSLAESAATIRSRAAAAVLATSRGSPQDVAVSHVGAALLWEFAGWWDPPEVFDVSGTHPRRVAGVRVHRVRALCDDEVAIIDGIPVTSPARTVLDIAGTGSSRELEQALAAAERLRPGCRAEIVMLLRRRPRHAGSGKLRQLLEALDRSGRPPLYLRSAAEALMVRLCARARLPAPGANVRVAGCEVDLLWLEHRVIVEVDGYEFHGSPDAFHRDRDRDRALATAGFHVLRFTWRQLTQEPEVCLAALCVALGRSGTR